MCDTADGPAGWQSTVDAAWQPQPGREHRAGGELGKGFTVPQRAQHMPSWGLELIRAGAVGVCVFNEDCSGGGGRKKRKKERCCWAGAGAAADTRYETDTKDMNGHVCACTTADAADCPGKWQSTAREEALHTQS